MAGHELSASTPAPAPAEPGALARVVAFFLVALLATVPIATVRRPPVLDLAPQVDQARRFVEQLGGAADPGDRVSWLTPNKISYPLLVAGWLAGGERHGARLGLALCLVALLAAIHALAAHGRRPIESAVLASTFAFSSFFYWGYFNFAVGGLAFVLFLGELDRDRAAGEPAHVRWIRRFGAGAFLYLAHALWLGAAMALAVTTALARTRRRDALLAASALAPWFVAAAAQFLGADDPEWTRGIVWRETPWDRLLAAATPGGLPGGVLGALEPILLAAVALWCVAGWSGARRKEGDRGSKRLAGIAVLFALFALLLPTSIGQTAHLAARWLPWAALLSVLAAPVPRVLPAWRGAIAGAVLLLFLAGTARVWIVFEREELAGFESALAGVPEGAALLGLDLERRSPRLAGRVYENLYLYAVAERGARPAFDFDQLASSLVRRTVPPDEPRWQPRRIPTIDRLRFDRLALFDRVLVHAPPREQARFASRFRRLVPVAGGDSWVLYRPTGRGDEVQLGAAPESSSPSSPSTSMTERPVRRSKR